MEETIGKSILDKIDIFNRACDKVSGCYFWHGDNGNARQRAERSAYLSASENFDFGGEHWELSLVVDVHRSYVAAEIRVYRGGKKTNRRALSTVVKKIEKQLSK